MTDTRYPYTYACDFIREHCSDWTEIADGVRVRCPSLSRAQASQVMGAFEKVFGLTHEQMAMKLADTMLAQGAKDSAAQEGDK